MYAGPVVPVAASAAVVTLPSTGGNLLVSAAVAVGAGLLTWGVMYARSVR